MIQLLGKGAGHKAVAQVDHKLHRGHFQIRGAGGYDAKAGKLAGACKIGKGDKHGLENREAGAYRHDAEGKGYSQIAEADGDAVDQSGIKRTFLLIHTRVSIPYTDFQRISRLTV